MRPPRSARRSAARRYQGLARDRARRPDRARRRPPARDRPRLRLRHAAGRRRGRLRDPRGRHRRPARAGCDQRLQLAVPRRGAARRAGADPDREARHRRRGSDHDGRTQPSPAIALAASIGLIGVYVAFGGGTYEPAETADPCADAGSVRPRGARHLRRHRALGARRSRLRAPRQPRGADARPRRRAGHRGVRDAHDIDSAAVDDAVRAGLERAVDDAAAAGKIDGVEESILRQVARYAPVGPAISGLQALSDDDSVQGLIRSSAAHDPRSRARTRSLAQSRSERAHERRRPTAPRGCVGRIRFGKDRRRPTLPGGFPPSTIGAEGLNGSVRNGKRCIPLAIATEIIRHRGGTPPPRRPDAPPSGEA